MRAIAPTGNDDPCSRTVYHNQRVIGLSFPIGLFYCGIIRYKGPSYRALPACSSPSAPSPARWACWPNLFGWCVASCACSSSRAPIIRTGSRPTRLEAEHTTTGGAEPDPCGRDLRGQGLRQPENRKSRPRKLPSPYQLKARQPVADGLCLRRVCQVRSIGQSTLLELFPNLLSHTLHNCGSDKERPWHELMPRECRSYAR